MSPIVITVPTPQPEPLTASASVSLSEDDKAWLVAECARKGMSQSAYLRHLIKVQRSLHVTEGA